MNFKKLSLIGALALVAVACGGKKEEAPVAAAPTAPVEINLWEQMEPSARAVYEKKVEEFNAANPNIKVVLTHYQNEDLRTQFQNASLSGQGPDVVYGPNDAAAIFEVSKLIKPVKDVIKPELLATFDANTLKSGEINGTLYALPEFDGNHIALLYNKKMVTKAPETFEEFVQVATDNTKVDNKDKANSVYGFLYNEKEPFWFVGFMNGLGGAALNDKSEPTLDSPATVEALQLAADLRGKYKLGEAGMDYDMADQLFKQGKAAMILNGAWSWKSYVDAGMDIGVSYMPLPNGKKAMFYNASKGYSFADGLKAEKHEAINKFFEFIYTPETNAEISLASAQVPAITKARELDVVKNDKLMADAVAMITYTTPQPVVAEMRAVWDAMRPNLEAVINGQATPADAAKKMQEDAVQGIKTIKGN